MTPTEIDNLPEYTLEQRLKLVRHQIVQVTEEGMQRGHNGRSKVNHQLAQLRAEEESLIQQIAVRDGTNTDHAVGLAEF